MKLKWFALFFFALSLGLYAQDDNDNWIKVAEKSVAFKSETDKVNLSGKERDITRIKIKCVQGTLQLKEVTIEMKNGKKETYDPKGTGLLTKGTSSIPFTVPDKGEEVKSIEMKWDSKGSMVTNKRAKVEIWGKKDKDDK